MLASEESRNRVLRRADWRFLLPVPNPERSVLYADGLLGDAVRAVSAHVVDGRRERPNRECDLAVAIDPDDATLRSAWSALAAGGACYTEWTPRLFGASVIRRRLEAAGFADVACYTHRPSSAEGPPQVWVPLGVRAAVRWELDRSRTVRGARHALGRVARRLGWRAAAWLPVEARICAVARRPATGSSRAARITADFQAELRRRIEERRRAAGLPPTRERLPWVLLTQGARSINKVVLLALAPDGSAEVAVKVPRTSAAADAVDQEAAVLRQVYATYGDVSGIPRVLFSGSCAGVRTVGETAMHGVPMSQLVHRGDYRTLAMKAAEWQARLVDRSDPRSPSSWWSRLIEPVLTGLDAPLGAIVDPSLMHATRTALAGLGPLPMACEQRDFSPWNVWLTPGGELAVLDWESAEPRGLPALDLIYFLTYLAVYRERAWTPERLREVHLSTLSSTTALGSITRECLERYAELTGIDTAALGPLRVLCWLVHAESEYRRTADDNGGRPDLSALRHSLFVALWQQELRSAWSAAA